MSATTNSPAPALRHLVACAACHRQYEAGGLEPGDRFHCSCGHVIEVQTPRPHESAVVRCSACGGPRLEGAASCRFCNSDFTLHERDLDTICPGCATRISRRARFCHACALPIDPHPTGAEPSGQACPACAADSELVSRPLGGEILTVLECPQCAGLWLGTESFRLLEDRAKERSPGWMPAPPPAAESAEATGGTEGRMYRPCPACGKLMHRRNYGKRSGTILDVCAEHGLWFDAGELEHVLRWIRDGGLARSQQRDAEDAAQAVRKAATAGLPPVTRPSGSALGGFLELILDWIARTRPGSS